MSWETQVHFSGSGGPQPALQPLAKPTPKRHPREHPQMGQGKGDHEGCGGGSNPSTPLAKQLPEQGCYTEATKAEKQSCAKTRSFNSPHPKPQQRLRQALPRHISHLAPDSFFYTVRASREGSCIPKLCPFSHLPAVAKWPHVTLAGHTGGSPPFLQLCTRPAPSHSSNRSPLAHSYSQGEVSNRQQEPPLPGAAGIATGNAQIRFLLEPPDFAPDLGDQSIQMTRKCQCGGERTPIPLSSCHEIAS